MKQNLLPMWCRDGPQIYDKQSMLVQISYWLAQIVHHAPDVFTLQECARKLTVAAAMRECEGCRTVYIRRRANQRHCSRACQRRTSVRRLRGKLLT